MKKDILDNDAYWYWFVNITGIGNVLRKRLLNYFSHPREIFHAKEHALADFLNKKQMSYFCKSRNTNDIEKSRDALIKNQVYFLHWESKNYPERFRQMADPPYGFYLKGQLPKEELPALGMVGSRMATPYGREMAGWFAKELAAKGVQIISGLAAGIDAASHKGALLSNGYTLGILGGGIDTLYPRENFSLYMELYERGGVLSEYNMGIPNQPGLFPVRNRLISGLSDGVFVLEAGKKSGSFITVDQALEQGKEVFALPGRISDPLSAGCNQLIAQGAIPVQHPDDILEILFAKKDIICKNADALKTTGTMSSAKKRMLEGQKCLEAYERKNKEKEIFVYKEPVFHTIEQKEVYRLLDENIPISFDLILEKTGYCIAQLQHILFEMELRQWIYQPSQNHYLKKFF